MLRSLTVGIKLSLQVYIDSITNKFIIITVVTGHFGTKTLRHQDSSAPRNWGRSVRTHQFFWCRTISWSLRTGAELSLCLITYKTAKDDKTIL